jgi:hypothetical protein
MSNSSGSRKKRVIRRLALVFLVLLALPLLLELSARYILGLGDPVLMTEGDTYDFIVTPNQDVRRFGPLGFRHRITINQWSMRSEPVAKEKSSKDEFRVLIVGDGVPFGVSWLDQEEILPYRLTELLKDEGPSPVTVLNAATGGWAVADEVAYLEEHGFFEADVCFWILNSLDLKVVDASKRIVGVNPRYPESRPLLASWELWERYLAPRLGLAPQPVAARTATDQDGQQVVEQFGQVLQRMVAVGIDTVVVLVPHTDELSGMPADFLNGVGAAAASSGVRVLDLSGEVKEALDSGADLFYDDIHPTAAGHEFLAEQLAALLRK